MLEPKSPASHYFACVEGVQKYSLQRTVCAYDELRLDEPLPKTVDKPNDLERRAVDFSRRRDSKVCPTAVEDVLERKRTADDCFCWVETVVEHQDSSQLLLKLNESDKITI
jgi:hypothetical protein